MERPEEATTALLLEQGAVIAYPTDTVWGLGCDASNPEAVARLAALKERPAGKALIVLVDSAETAARYVSELPDVARKLLEERGSRPLTVIVAGARGLAPGVAAEDGTIAFRVPQHGFCREVCRRLGRPLVSTSANTSGQPTPRCFAEIAPEVLEAMDYVVKQGREAPQEPVGPSRIVRVNSDGEVAVIRP